ncbi:MAG: hypothetical protein AAF432_10335 [Planctomycetota bacterium]
MQSTLALPESYKEFVLRFGNTKLYRTARMGYEIGVFAGPRPGRLNDGTVAYEIGFHDGARVFVKPINGPAGSAVWEAENGSQERTYADFGEWLEKSCRHAREQYTPEQWSENVRGPKPFTQEEQEILAARRSISWKVIGIDSDGNHTFQVKNSSNRILPVLTIGVRSTDGRLNGATKLRIHHVRPGQTANVIADCYKEFRLPEEVEVFDLPEPEPQDRAYFDELSTQTE